MSEVKYRKLEPVEFIQESDEYLTAGKWVRVPAFVVGVKLMDSYPREVFRRPINPPSQLAETCAHCGRQWDDHQADSEACPIFDANGDRSNWSSEYGYKPKQLPDDGKEKRTDPLYDDPFVGDGSDLCEAARLYNEKWNTTSAMVSLPMVRNKLAESRAVIDRQQKEIEQAVADRDCAEETLSKAIELVTGDWPDWSNIFGHSDALIQIDETIAALRAELDQVKKERESAVFNHSVTCVDHTDAERKDSGCPVCLKRENDRLKADLENTANAIKPQRQGYEC